MRHYSTRKTQKNKKKEETPYVPIPYDIGLSFYLKLSEFKMFKKKLTRVTYLGFEDGTPRVECKTGRYIDEDDTFLTIETKLRKYRINKRFVIMVYSTIKEVDENGG